MEILRISFQNLGNPFRIIGILSKSPAPPLTPRTMEFWNGQSTGCAYIYYILQSGFHIASNSGRSCFDAAVSLRVSESLSLSLPSLKRARQKFLGVHRCLVWIKKFSSGPDLYDMRALFPPTYFLLRARKPQTEAVFWKME